MPGKLTPFLFSTFPGITASQINVLSETCFLTVKLINPSLIKILAPGFTDWNLTTLETGIIPAPSSSLLIFIESPLAPMFF